ncbi:MAG: L-threonine 3-dehydrogenase [Candidatus Eisenbacteria bacterium]|nr:L-threonine 3-dehydrogenase [Candidatus Eisenbacteria bacterium]
MPKTMRALVKPGPRAGAELRTVEVPSPGPRDVLVRVLAASVCGTDLHIYSWDEWAASRFKAPMTFGHEFCGEIVQCGSEVENVKVGDYVTAETHVICHTCYQCRTGQGHVCENVSILGVDRPGIFADYAVIPAENAWVTDRRFPPEIATLQEPFGNAVHTSLTGRLTAKSVLVSGCGPLGLFCVALSKFAGASHVFATETQPLRRDLAKKVGATAVFDPMTQDVVAEVHQLTGGAGVDVLLETAGAPAAIESGFKCLKYAGRASLIGLPSKPFPFDFTNQVIFKGATVIGISGREMFETWYSTRALLEGGLDLSPIITHKLPLEEFEKAFQLIASGQCGKIVFKVAPPEAGGIRESR